MDCSFANAKHFLSMSNDRHYKKVNIGSSFAGSRTAAKKADVRIGLAKSRADILTGRINEGKKKSGDYFYCRKTGSFLVIPNTAV